MGLWNLILPNGIYDKDCKVRGRRGGGGGGNHDGGGFVGSFYHSLSLALKLLNLHAYLFQS